MTFQLDTTGEVATDYNPVTKWRWSDLSPFVQGYIEALFKSPLLQRDEDMPVTLGFSDLAPETLARIIADCEAFAPGRHPWMTAVEYGRAFYEARQNGFSDWSVDPIKYGQRFPPLTALLADDGKVRVA